MDPFNLLASLFRTACALGLISAGTYGRCLTLLMGRILNAQTDQLLGRPHEPKRPSRKILTYNSNEDGMKLIACIRFVVILCDLGLISEATKTDACFAFLDRDRVEHLAS